jgi:hypothetical protein
MGLRSNGYGQDYYIPLFAGVEAARRAGFRTRFPWSIYAPYINSGGSGTPGGIGAGDGGFETPSDPTLSCPSILFPSLIDNTSILDTESILSDAFITTQSNKISLSPISFGPSLPTTSILNDSGGLAYIGGDSIQIVEFDVTFPGPLPTGGGWHLGVMQRASIEGINTVIEGQPQYNGVGTIFGSVFKGVVAPNGMTSMDNNAAVEVWQIGQIPLGFQHVKPETYSPMFQADTVYKFRGVSVFSGTQRTYQYSFGGYTSPVVTHDLAVSANNNGLAFFCIGDVPALLTNITSEWTSATHIASRWIVELVSADGSEDLEEGSGLIVYDSGVTQTNLRALPLAPLALGALSTYRVKVRYKASSGGWSCWSLAREFTMGPCVEGVPIISFLFEGAQDSEVFTNVGSMPEIVFESLGAGAHPWASIDTTYDPDGDMRLKNSDKLLSNQTVPDLEDFTLLWKMRLPVGQVSDGTIFAAHADGSGAEPGWWIELGTTRGFFFYANLGTRLAFPAIGTTLDDGLEHEYRVVREAGEITFYVDDVETASATYAGTLTAGGDKTAIGSMANGTDFVYSATGWFSELHLYDIAIYPA